VHGHAVQSGRSPDRVQDAHLTFEASARTAGRCCRRNPRRCARVTRCRSTQRARAPIRPPSPDGVPDVGCVAARFSGTRRSTRGYVVLLQAFVDWASCLIVCTKADTFVDCAPRLGASSPPFKGADAIILPRFFFETGRATQQKRRRSRNSTPPDRRCSMTSVQPRRRL